MTQARLKIGLCWTYRHGSQAWRMRLAGRCSGGGTEDIVSVCQSPTSFMETSRLVLA